MPSLFFVLYSNGLCIFVKDVFVLLRWRDEQSGLQMKLEGQQAHCGKGCHVGLRGWLFVKLQFLWHMAVVLSGTFGVAAIRVQSKN
ncbi:hypothetical protein CBR_g32541 [Chara braunii]|uniref:Uncharacterized protein n=1 Tax=Chara braunii TaxID=69332 RepID=A0A388LH21_CHABU|nr:hypothetical protein CBR_g32541 [Chara braunii]|eukprot:GBG81551.1 hypothetical protein CBR_g32541 [Chara braunii]